jgi:hypothetical protein
VRSSVFHVVLVLHAAEVLAQATNCLLLLQSAGTTMQPLFDHVFPETVPSSCVCLLYAGRLHCCCVLENYNVQHCKDNRRPCSNTSSVVVVDLSNAHIYIRSAHPVRYHLASMRSISFLVVSLTVSPNCSSYCSSRLPSFSWCIPKRTCIRSWLALVRLS